MKKFTTFLLLALMTVTASAAGKQLYFVGNAPVGVTAGDAGWGFDADHQLPLTLAADGVTNTASVDVTGQAWFAISDGGGTSWDDFNTNHRYSCNSFNNKQSGNYQLEKLGNHAISLVAGHYDISINSETMVMTIVFTPAAPPTETTYSVVGDPALGLVWDFNADNIVMTKKSDQVYELVKEDITLQAGKDYLWRILVNGKATGWENQYGAHGHNQQGGANGDDNIVSNFDEDGVYTITFTLDLSNGEASVPTVKAVKKGEVAKNYLYVSDETGWVSLKVYAWGTAEIFGNWGSTSVTDAETTVINGVTYHKLSFFSNDGEEHLIFFNGIDDAGDEDPTRALVDIYGNKDTYVKVVSGKAEVVDPSVYTSISTVKEAPKAGVRYNLSGQQIGQGYKGIIIVNGKKVIQ
mgnify:CR=1 FL=1